jgi:hypothetical protein
MRRSAFWAQHRGETRHSHGGFDQDGTCQPTSEEVAAVRTFIEGWKVAWVTTAAAAEALDLETRMKAEWSRTDGRQRVRNEPDERVWLPLRSIASTSQLYAVRLWRNPFGMARRAAGLVSWISPRSAMLPSASARSGRAAAADDRGGFAQGAA